MSDTIDTIDTEEIVKEYDPQIIRRILAFVKPYWKGFLLAMLALLVGTACELALPIVTQKIFDNYILASWRAIDVSKESLPQFKSIGALAEDPVIAGYRYIPTARFSSMSQAEQESLKAAGAFAPGGFRYLFPAEAGSKAAETALRHRDIIASEGSWAAISRDDLAKLNAGELASIRGRDIQGILDAVVIILCLLFGVLIFSFIQTYIASLIGQYVMKDMRIALFKHVSNQSLGFLGGQPVGRLVTRLTSDVETVNEFFTSVVVSFMKDLSIMIGVIAVLIGLSAQLGLVTVVTLLPVAVATVIARAKARDAFRKQRKWVSKVNSYLSEHLSGVAVVKLFAQEKRCEGEFEKANNELLRASLGEMYVFATFRPLTDFLSAISTACVIYFGAQLFLSLSISLGVLIAFITLVQMFYNPVMDITEKYTILQSAMAGGERVFKLLDTVERIPDEGAKSLPGPARGHIEFDHVRFSYKKGEEIIRDLSFTVKPGEMVAIVGYTGAGKTTITNLLTRLWDVDSGQIKLDGVPIKDIPLAELRASVQPVSQDVFLFTGSVEENIRLGVDMPPERVREAAKAVYADAFISKMEGGYDAHLSEGATNISTGQRQLISFARVIAHDPRIVILDEATSSIDTETEKLIQKALVKLLEGRTSIVIAHRLSTIKHADRILVLAQGKLVEEGNHEELLAKDGVYAGLYKLQYGDGE